VSEVLRAARVRAPVRLDFAGGWTDVPPFSGIEGGAVVNAAIRLFANAEIVPGGRGITLASRDLNDEIRIETLNQLPRPGRLELLQAALRVVPVEPPFRLETGSDAPPGSGLGSSGALDVALVAALTRATGADRSPHQLAELAWKVEAGEAGIAGGKQDQFAAALGGMHVLEFHDPVVTAKRIELDSEFAAVLARQTVLCYTGHSRVSGATITRVMTAYRQRDMTVTGALREMKDLALAMAEALTDADLERVGRLLSRNWECQQALDPDMQTEPMKRLEAAVSSAGVLGVKAAGAGAGGSMFFITPGDAAPVRAAAASLGMTILPVEWSSEGVHQC
jgi:D-glycero-alpha-D-manno-heptose-7-phosphate kinase